MGWLARLSGVWVLWFAVGVQAAPPTLNLMDLPAELAIAPQAWLLEDVGKQVNLVQLQTAASRFDWQPISQNAPNFSFSDSAYWLWFRLYNPDENLQKRVLQIAMPLQDYIDFYQIDVNQGDVVKSFRTGDRREYDSRPVRATDFVFPIDLKPGQQYDFFIRFDSHDGLYDALPMTLWKLQPFHEYTSHTDLVYGAYYGALLSILIFNLFLFVSTRERVFLLYSFYLAAFFVWNFTFRGWAYLYWWPEWPHFNSQMTPIAGSLIFIFMIWFSTTYLQTKTLLPRIHKLMWLMAVLISVGIVMGLFNMYATIYAWMTPVYFLTLIVILLAGVMLVIKGQRAAKFFLLAWAVLLVGAMIYFLRLAGLIPSSPLTEYSLQVGSVLEFMLLAFGLADRINVLKSEKVALQQAALDNERLVALRLEDLVKRRTEQLEMLNKRLANQSITDGLTLVYNRRHFNEQLHDMINNRSFALLLIDIDNFKLYNDRYGHQAGDKALIKVARTLQRLALRVEGEVYRVGGEEFACLLPCDHFDQAVPTAQRLCDEVAALAIEHQDNNEGIITISIGLAWVEYRPGRNADEVYARADKALYQAKDQGRNQLVINL